MSHHSLLSTGPCTVTCDGNPSSTSWLQSRETEAPERLGHIAQVTQQSPEPRAGLASLWSPSVSHISGALGPCWAPSESPTGVRRLCALPGATYRVILEPCSFIQCAPCMVQRNVEQSKNTLERPVDMEEDEGDGLWQILPCPSYSVLSNVFISWVFLASLRVSL